MSDYISCFACGARVLNNEGEMSIFELWNNEDIDQHFYLAERWALSVWASWSQQHQRIADLVNRIRN